MASEKRFIRVHKEGISLGAVTEIYVDTQTRVQYLYHYDVPTGGLTVLLGQDGRPLLYQGSLEDLQ